MASMIQNAIKPINKRDLRTCKRCGCPDLAWIQFKSGKWALVRTTTQRPLWRGEGPRPEGLWAMKMAYHRCDEYQATQAEIERRASECHPQASTPAEILGDAAGYLVRGVPVQEWTKMGTDHPLTQAVTLLFETMTGIQNFQGAVAKEGTCDI